MTQRKTVAIPRDRTKSVHPTSSSLDEARWRLVLAHTPTPDFLYGVLSTGIFCRTSCPSRRPRRANVRFFDSAASAVAAGFRACRRCRPESTDSSHESPQASAEKQVEIACEYVRQRKGEAQLLEIAVHVGLSPRYFHGLFKQVLGTTPGAYAAAVRRESSISMTPVITVPDSTPHAVDIETMTNLAHLAPIDESAYSMSVVDSHPSMHDWLPEVYEGLSCTDFERGAFSEWLNDCDSGVVKFLGTSNESFEPRLDTYTSDYVDPSLLSSSRVAS
ncbi:hypothetical protein E0Z10_g7261 [Xylaria hypoxylon]|uniref:HTH araC/xylS-type domain-containing protein n=1 Tax=Xylaria hypoxylon TaxID=37992 RepID=A0A4Z0YPY2_9PEZI|nr:hypothetical protein E0Z10_g7261 [Xylaria hypoxylon]